MYTFFSTSNSTNCPRSLFFLGDRTMYPTTGQCDNINKGLTESPACDCIV